MKQRATTRVVKVVAGAGLVAVAGVIDEDFAGFSVLDALESLVLDVSGVTAMTSFGVRQWLAAMEALPRRMTDCYMLGCPTVFVDQLNMVLGFGGPARVLTVVAPYLCATCGAELRELVDVLAERKNLAKGVVPARPCRQCGALAELDESPDSYFGFVNKYAPANVSAPVARLLAQLGLFHVAHGAVDKPVRVIKLVHGSVTYFQVVGVIGSQFRARPFLVGAEGEVVIDLAEVERFDPLALSEWRRLLKSLSAHVPAVTLVDVTGSLLEAASDTFRLARNIYASSLLVSYRCVDCGRTSPVSHALAGATWPLALPDRVCPACGATTRHELPPGLLAPLQAARTDVPPASAKIVLRRAELVSRAVTDANVAQAGEAAAAPIRDEMILGKYKIVRRLSAGGMAEVFLANQIGFGGFEKPVALKRIQSKLLESRHLAIDMFLNEAKIAGRLTHPNIVQVLDVGEVNGALYLAMEYVRGRDLRDVIKQLRASSTELPLGIACHIVSEIALALHHAYWTKDMQGHQLAVVHRDVTPHNVILSTEGQVKLLDFGVAMSAVTEQAASLIVGKWSYMSPEHSTGKNIDHRSDLFSLGVILYLLCTGSMPFAGADPRQIIAQSREGAYLPPQEIAPHLDPALATLITRMLSPAPEGRPRTGQEVASILRDVMRRNRCETTNAHVAALLGALGAPARTAEPTPADATQKHATGASPWPPRRDATGASKSPTSFISETLRPDSVSQTFGQSRVLQLGAPALRPGAPAVSMRIVIGVAALLLALAAVIGWLMQAR